MALRVRKAGRFGRATIVARDRCGAALVPVPLVRLRAGRSAVSYPVPTVRRAVLEIGPMVVSRGDPFGLAHSDRAFGGRARVWVHPTVHPIQAIPVGTVRSLEGRVDAVAHGSITFHALREYVVGDDLRHVHWRTSARIGELMVREHVDTSEPRITVLLDDRLAAYQVAPAIVDGSVVAGREAYEASCEAAASVLVAALRAGLATELHLVGGRSAAGGSATPFLDLLADAELYGEADGVTGGDELRIAVERLRHRRLGDTLVFLTGPRRAEDVLVVGALRDLYPSVVVGRLGATDRGRAVTGGLLVINAESGADFAASWDGRAESSP